MKTHRNHKIHMEPGDELEVKGFRIRLTGNPDEGIDYALQIYVPATRDLYPWQPLYATDGRKIHFTADDFSVGITEQFAKRDMFNSHGDHSDQAREWLENNVVTEEEIYGDEG